MWKASGGPGAFFSVVGLVGSLGGSAREICR
ncbi:Protein of unknown function [Bacillus toyonensis]|nr:Protein of unknown function [Bacillus toyonensis]